MICKKCLKELETAFVLRSQIRHHENSYFQVRRDEMEIRESDDEAQQNDSEAMFETEIAVKSEAIEESFAIQVTTANISNSDDPLLEVNFSNDDDYNGSNHLSEPNLSDDEKDEDYGAKKMKKKGLECSECDKVLSCTQTLARHIHSVHGNERKFTCESCDGKFRTKYNLSQHLIRHIKNPKSEVKNVRVDTLNKNRKFPCDECSNFFKTAAALKQHKMLHTNIRPYVCHCGKAFRRNDHLKQHKNIHDKTAKNANM
jgi:RNase P subunit RPR2